MLLFGHHTDVDFFYLQRFNIESLVCSSSFGQRKAGKKSYRTCLLISFHSKGGKSVFLKHILDDGGNRV